MDRKALEMTTPDFKRLVKEIENYLKEAEFQLDSCGDNLVSAFLFGKAEALADELYKRYYQNIAEFSCIYVEKACELDCEIFGRKRGEKI